MPKHKKAQSKKSLVKLQNTSFQPRKEFENLKDVSRKLVGKICLSNCNFPLIKRVAEKFGMMCTVQCHPWNVMWMDSYPSISMCKEMTRSQRVNHFIGITDISRKNNLASHLNQMKKAYPKDYNFFPRSWCLPYQFSKLLQYSKKHPETVFIFKPNYGCEGKGISITHDVSEFEDTDKMVAQEYIQAPLLVSGFKFDLRLYVLISSVNPMRLYLYNEGLARFATREYLPSSSNYDDHYMHLTNYSVNKNSATFQFDFAEGSKRKLSMIKEFLQSNGCDVDEVTKQIDSIIIKTIILAAPKMKFYYQKCFPKHLDTLGAFELLGFDFILNSNQEPILLEINRTPSFSIYTEVDLKVKEPLIRDTFRILNLSKNNTIKKGHEERSRAKQKKPTPQDLSFYRKNLEQIAKWERNHMGNYRQIYPPTSNLNKYQKFFDKATSLFLKQEKKNDRTPVVSTSDRLPKPEIKDNTTQTEPLDGVCLKETHGILEGFQKILDSSVRKRIQNEIIKCRSNDWIDVVDGEYKYELRKIANIIQNISRNDKLSREAKEKLTKMYNKTRAELEYLAKMEKTKTNDDPPSDHT